MIMLRGLDFIRIPMVAMIGLIPSLAFTQNSVLIYQSNGNLINAPVSLIDSIIYTSGSPISSFEVTTDPGITGTSFHTAHVSGEVVSSSSVDTVIRGVCYGLNENPTLSDGFVADPTTGVGAFSVSVPGLEPASTYYFRTFASTSNLTFYGDVIIYTTPVSHTVGGGVQDIDGYNYSTVIIGGDEWMAENLRTSRYANGDTIAFVEDDLEWDGYTIGKTCWYENDSTTYGSFGRLYNWPTTVDPRNVCPVNWHVPSDLEWYELMSFLDSNAETLCSTCLDYDESLIGSYMLQDTLYPSDFGFATNSAGFNGKTLGYRDGFGDFEVPSSAHWWTTTEYYSQWAILRRLNEHVVEHVQLPRDYGMSIRCVKD